MIITGDAPWPRLLHGFALAAFAAFAAVQLLPVAHGFPNGLIDDDGYFYAQIAYNLARLGMSTFDGLTVTSGYHLLWAGMLAALSKAVLLVTHDKSVHMFAYLLINVAIALLVAWRAFRDPATRAAVFALFFLASLLMETVLLTALLVWLFARFLDEREPFGGRASDWLVIALIPLTRIDASVVPGLLIGWLLLRRSGAVLRAAAALALGVAAHFAFMKWAFGEFVSVSALLKLTATGNFAYDLPVWVINTTASPAQAIRVAIVLGLAALAALNIAATAPGETRRRKLVVLAALIVMFLPPFFLISMRSWYFLPIHVGLFYLAARADGMADRGRGLARAVPGFAGLVVASYLAGALEYHLRHGANQVNTAAFVRALKDHVPPGAPIFQIDSSGFVGYFAERPVINGDGLMNSHEFARRLVRRELGSYLAEMRICWLVRNHRDEKTQAGRRMLVEHFGLEVPREAAVRVLRTPQDDRNIQPYYTLYRLDAPHCGARPIHNTAG